LEVGHLEEECLPDLSEGTIGAAQTVKYMAFRKLRNEVPDPNAILRGEDVMLPAKTEILFILATSILRGAKKEHVSNLVKFINRLAALESRDGMKVGVEVSVYLARAAMHGANKDLASITCDRELITWLEKNGKYM
jgi:hypothetical protein